MMCTAGGYLFMCAVCLTSLQISGRYRSLKTHCRYDKEPRNLRVHHLAEPVAAKAIYKDNADTIVGNRDTTLFLAARRKRPLKKWSEILGKETIDSFNTSETRGRELSHGLNYQKLGKQLMSEDEIAVMDGGKCILQLRGCARSSSEKYDITKHPEVQVPSDFDKKNAFDMEKTCAAVPQS